MKPQFLNSFFLCLLILCSQSCNRKSRAIDDIAPVIQEINTPTNEKAQETDAIVNETVNLKIKIYIENSGSMFGYVKGPTQLKDALHNLLVDLKYFYDEQNIEVYFINSKIHKSPIKTELTGFANKLSPYSIKIGQTGSSNLNNIFKQVTSEIEDNSISILLSDFIYSIKGEKSNVLLGEQQALTKDVFLTASKKGQDLTTNVYQFTSEFNGTYYDYNNHPGYLQANRPYYYAIIGEQKNVNAFSRKLSEKFRNYSGYTNEYLLTEEDFAIKNFSVLTATLNKGRLKPVRTGTDIKQVRAIEVEERGRDNDNLEIAVAVDLVNLKISENYKTNAANYDLGNRGFELKEIATVIDSEIQLKDGQTVVFSPAEFLHLDFTPTHVFVFKAKEGNVTSLDFELRRNIPGWVSASSLVDDTNLVANPQEQLKTFGLDYLIRGISEAYLQATKKDQYFTINIPIHKEKSSSFGGMAMAIIFIGLFIGLILLIISKSKKRK